MNGTVTISAGSGMTHSDLRSRRCAKVAAMATALAVSIGGACGCAPMAAAPMAAAPQPAAQPAAAATNPASTVAATATAVASDSRALHDLFDRHWAWVERTYPEWSTYRGDHRFGDRLADASAAARARDEADERRWLDEARALPVQGLSAHDRVSLDIFIHERRSAVDMQRFAGWRSMKIAALGGLQSDFADLMLVVPVASREHIDQLLARFAGLPRRIDDEIAHMREGIALGWVPSKKVLERALRQIDAELAPVIDKGPYFEPFRRLPTSVPEAQRRQWQTDGRAAIERHVLPAMRALRRFVADEYRPKAPGDGSLMRYPDGPKVYAALAAFHASTTMAPEQIHATGLRELQRLRARMEDVMREARFAGGFDRFVRWLHTDRRFHYLDADALLAHYREIGKRADAALPPLFAELPRAPWGVRAMPEHFDAGHAEYYENPTDDVTRAGTFFANAAAWRQKRRWQAETLVAHEAVPGHHVQSARALELKGLPAFRRHGWHTAYGEGWALYAETLGVDMGLYPDPYSRFGHLQGQAFRAARLVVDTGIHTQGWSRQRAIDFMVERTGVGRDFVTSEVDRYTSDPGQALAYMIGKLEIDRLRDRARQTLGAAFDIRRFHNAVLDQGPMPLETLARVIDVWVEQEKMRLRP
jgi:uncharacterized protein (DUF885 family)